LVVYNNLLFSLFGVCFGGGGGGERRVLLFVVEIPIIWAGRESDSSIKCCKVLRSRMHDTTMAFGILINLLWHRVGMHWTVGYFFLLTRLQVYIYLRHSLEGNKNVILDDSSQSSFKIKSPPPSPPSPSSFDMTNNKL